MWLPASWLWEFSIRSRDKNDMTYVVKQTHWSARSMRSLKKWKSSKRQLKNFWQRKGNLFDVKKLLPREILKIYMNHVLFGVKLTSCSFTVSLCKSKARVKLFNFVDPTSFLLCLCSLFLHDWAQINKERGRKKHWCRIDKVEWFDPSLKLRMQCFPVTMI